MKRHATGPLLVFLVTALVCGSAAGQAPPGSSRAVLLYDDFSDGDNRGWTVTEGAWDATSRHNAPVGFFPLEYAYTYSGDAAWTDYSIDVDLRFGTATNEFYLDFRADPASGLGVAGGLKYYLSLDGDSDLVRLRYRDLAGFTDVQVVPFALVEGQTYPVHLEVEGFRVVASVGGSLLIDYTFAGSDPLYRTGLVGIGYKDDADGAYFDNIVVIGAPVGPIYFFPQIDNASPTSAQSPAIVNVQGSNLSSVVTATVNGTPATILGQTSTSLSLQPQADEPGFANLVLQATLGSGSGSLELWPSLTAVATGVGGTITTTLHNGGTGLYVVAWGARSLSVPLALTDPPTWFGLLLDPASPIVVATSGATVPGSPAVDIGMIPNDPTLSGQVVHVQAWAQQGAFGPGVMYSFSNMVSVTL